MRWFGSSVVVFVVYRLWIIVGVFFERLVFVAQHVPRLASQPSRVLVDLRVRRCVARLMQLPLSSG